MIHETRSSWCSLILSSILLLAGGCADKARTSAEDPALDNPVRESGEPDPVRDATLGMLSKLRKELRTETQAICLADSPAAQLDSLRAFIRKLMADYVLKAMQKDLLSVLQSTVDVIKEVKTLRDRVRSASALTGYAVNTLTSLLVSLLGPAPFDPICQPDHQVRPEWSLEKLLVFARDNLLADDLIVSQEPGRSVFYFDSQRVCPGLFAEGSQELWTDLQAVCEEILDQGRMQAAITLEPSADLLIDLTLQDGLVPLATIRVSATRTVYSLTLDLARAYAVIQALGYDKFLGPQSQFSGVVGIELRLPGDDATAQDSPGVRLALRIEPPIALRADLLLEGEGMGTVTLGLGQGSSESQTALDVGMTRDGALHGYEINLADFSATYQPDPANTTRIVGPLELGIPLFSVSSRASGKPFAVKLTRLRFGGPINLGSAGQPVCRVEINPESEYQLDVDVRKSGKEYLMTADPGLSIRAACQPVSGAFPEGLSPLFKPYAFDFPPNEFSLSIQSTLLIDTLAALLKS